MRLSVFINGVGCNGNDRTLDEAASQIAEAHRAGDRWDVRRRTRGQSYRPLLENETATLVAAVTKELT